MSKTYRCGWCGKSFAKPILLEKKSLSGTWAKCCKRCKAKSERISLSNPLSAMFPEPEYRVVE